jgi:hypothetical protein
MGPAGCGIGAAPAGSASPFTSAFTGGAGGSEAAFCRKRRNVATEVRHEFGRNGFPADFLRAEP